MCKERGCGHMWLDRVNSSDNQSKLWVEQLHLGIEKDQLRFGIWSGCLPDTTCGGIWAGLIVRRPMNLMEGLHIYWHGRTKWSGVHSLRSSIQGSLANLHGSHHKSYLTSGRSEMYDKVVYWHTNLRGNLTLSQTGNYHTRLVGPWSPQEAAEGRIGEGCICPSL